MCFNAWMSCQKIKVNFQNPRGQYQQKKKNLVLKLLFFVAQSLDFIGPHMRYKVGREQSRMRRESRNSRIKKGPPHTPNTDILSR